MRLDHLLSKEKFIENMNRSYWSVVIDGFRLMLFNFEGPFEKVDNSSKWGCSSAGRAPALQAGGHRFDPVHLHQDEGL